MHAPTVRRKLPPEIKRAAADLADEWFITGMDVVVLLEIDGLPEAFVTLVALEG